MSRVQDSKFKQASPNHPTTATLLAAEPFGVGRMVGIALFGIGRMAGIDFFFGGHGFQNSLIST